MRVPVALADLLPPFIDDSGRRVGLRRGRLRDLALVELDALVIGDRAQELSAAFTDDVAGSLREA